MRTKEERWKSLIEQEIEWCEKHFGIKSKGFEKGFIAGLRQALLLLKSIK